MTKHLETQDIDFIPYPLPTVTSVLVFPVFQAEAYIILAPTDSLLHVVHVCARVFGNVRARHVCILVILSLFSPKASARVVSGMEHPPSDPPLTRRRRDPLLPPHLRSSPSLSSSVSQ